MQKLLRILVIVASVTCAGRFAAAAEPLALIDPAASAAQGQLKVNDRPDDTRFELTDEGIDVTVRQGAQAGYPGIAVLPDKAEVWDLSQYGHVEARITNTGSARIYVTVRVDNPGHYSTNPWNAEAKVIQPGKTDTVKVIFGHSFGFKPAFKLNPATVKTVLIFIGKSPNGASFRVESLTAGGQAGEAAPVNPAAVRYIPKDGVIVGPDVDIQKQFKIGTNNATSRIVDGVVQIDLPSGKSNRIAIRPAVGRYNLRDYLQVAFVIRNTGDTPLFLRAGLESDKGKSDWVSVGAPIAAGETGTITVPFRSENIWHGPKSFEGEARKGTGGSLLASNVISGFALEADASDAARSFRVESITASMPPAHPLPQWLGKRPPVDGDWTKTFDENFDGDSINYNLWSIYASNYWDKRSHFSKDNVIPGDGVVRLRFEKKTGHHNDNPDLASTDYATGFLHTYGKWVQRYGYFEARMKLPKAPGMWPAFWLMPDRGADTGPQWKRADTANGGMEFDIMEYLSRWGGNRNSAAFHWDGYQKSHKSTGVTIYAAPDADGYITSGLLWLPGLAVIYYQGEEVARWESPRVSDVPSYPIFTAVSGGWDNDPLDDAQFPSDFVIDYVRVWQRADLASKVDGPQPNRGGPGEVDTHH